MSPTSGTCLYRFIIFAMWHLKNAAFNFSIFESTEEIFSSMETTLSCKSFNWILFEMHIDTKKDDKTTIVMTMMTLCCLILRLSIIAFNLTVEADMLKRRGLNVSSIEWIFATKASQEMKVASCLASQDYNNSSFQLWAWHVRTNICIQVKCVGSWTHEIYEGV